MTTLTTADLAPSAQPEPAPDPRPLSAPISRALSLVVLVLLAALLVDVLFEGWVQQLFGHPGLPNAKGDPTWILADWPKNVKTGLFLLVLGFTVIKVAVDKSWRDFFTKAELALVALGVIMAISGFFGGRGAVLIGQALFVYFRGVIVFFAWRAVRPTTKQLKPILYLVGGIAVLNAGLAIVETLIGYPAYQWLGWTDLTWARINRAHALLNHPNHLGHFLMIVEIGLIAWFSTKDKISKKLWFLFGFLALGMSATQSRESAIGFVLAAVVIWWMRRRPVRPLAIALILVVGFTGLQLLNSTENRVTLEKRILGVLAALHFGAGSSAEDQPGIPAREIRVLFYQQGAKLFVERPVLGYGVGQFGGTVAFQHDPTWYKKFNFNLYGAKPDQVDSFWLHLAVETGALGVLGYLVWLFFLIAPMVRSRTRGPDVSPYVLWGGRRWWSRRGGGGLPVALAGGPAVPGVVLHRARARVVGAATWRQRGHRAGHPAGRSGAVGDQVLAAGGARRRRDRRPPEVQLAVAQTGRRRRGSGGLGDRASARRTGTCSA
ncbi:O-antigen ligase family protein [Fodinicola feengrottensis]|uniref:O-antigen ligase family protein n=1 Tax=Fodinicola feengrottensis TaxID=435914 RepID=UPI0013D6AC63|nr:O-antigen ligase family protein [Fodinicola feengrottensis]